MTRMHVPKKQRKKAFKKELKRIKQALSDSLDVAAKWDRAITVEVETPLSCDIRDGRVHHEPTGVTIYTITIEEPGTATYSGW